MMYKEKAVEHRGGEVGSAAGRLTMYLLLCALRYWVDSLTAPRLSSLTREKGIKRGIYRMIVTFRCKDGRGGVEMHLAHSQRPTCPALLLWDGWCAPHMDAQDFARPRNNSTPQELVRPRRHIEQVFEQDRNPGQSIPWACSCTKDIIVQKG